MEYLGWVRCRGIWGEGKFYFWYHFLFKTLNNEKVHNFTENSAKYIPIEFEERKCIGVSLGSLEKACPHASGLFYVENGKINPVTHVVRDKDSKIANDLILFPHDKLDSSRLYFASYNMSKL